MSNTEIINTEQVVTIAAYLGSTPARVATVLTDPEVSRDIKLFLLDLVPSIVDSYRTVGSKAVN
jgi:hypothetical protein